MSKWPSDKEPLNVEAVINVDNEITYVVRRKTRLQTKLDRSNTILVTSDGFKHSFPELIIKFYQSRVIWGDPDTSIMGTAEEAEILKHLGSPKNLPTVKKEELEEVIDIMRQGQDDVITLDDDDKQSSIMLGDPNNDQVGLPEDTEDTEVSTGEDSGDD